MREQQQHKHGVDSGRGVRVYVQMRVESVFLCFLFASEKKMKTNITTWCNDSYPVSFAHYIAGEDFLFGYFVRLVYKLPTIDS